MTIKLPLENGQQIKIDYAKMIASPIKGTPDIVDDAKIFWIGKINDYLATEFSTENTRFLSEVFSLNSLLRQAASSTKISERLITIRDTYTRAGSESEINLAGEIRKVILLSIDGYLQNPSPATLQNLQDALKKGVEQIEATLESDSKRRYVNSENFKKDLEEYKTVVASLTASFDTIPTRDRSTAVIVDSPDAPTRARNGAITADGFLNPLLLGDTTVVRSMTGRLNGDDWKFIQTQIEETISSKVTELLESGSLDFRFTVGELIDMLSNPIEPTTSTEPKPPEVNFKQIVREALLEQVMSTANSRKENRADLENLLESYSIDQITNFFDVSVVDDIYSSFIEKSSGDESHLNLVLKSALLDAKQHWLSEKTVEIPGVLSEIDININESAEEVQAKEKALDDVQARLAELSEDAANYKDLELEEAKLRKELEDILKQQKQFDEQKKEMNEDKIDEEKHKTEKELEKRRTEVFSPKR